MKKYILTLVCVLATAIQYASAQKYPLMGKITDASGNAVTTAAISVASDGQAFIANANEAGLYYTDMLEEGRYTAYITANGITYQQVVDLHSPKIAGIGAGNFYNFKLVDGNAILTISNEDPFMETSLLKAKEKPVSIDYPVSGFSNQPQRFNLLPVNDNGNNHFMEAPRRSTPRFEYKTLDKIKSDPVIMDYPAYDFLNKPQDFNLLPIGGNNTHFMPVINDSARRFNYKVLDKIKNDPLYYDNSPVRKRRHIQ